MHRLIPSWDKVNPFNTYDTDLIPTENTLSVPQSQDDISKKNVLNFCILILSIFIFTWHLYYGLERPITRRLHTALHFVMLLPLVFLADLKLDDENRFESFQDYVTLAFLAAAVISTTYAFIHFDRWMDQGRFFIYSTTDLTIAGILLVTFTYAAWRSFGFVFFLVTLTGIAYGYLGPYLPAIFYHGGLSLERIIARNTISIGGLFGNITFVVATWVVIFILYAGIIEGHGGLKYIMFLGLRAQNAFSTGVVQTSVISSLLVGSVNAASMANVATTGAFTIPLMKKHGVEPKIAAAIESLASTGGQIMPPIMGAASFLLADFVGVPYSTVLIGALLPALGFYFTVAISAHLVALKHGWTSKGDSRNEPTESIQPSKPDDVTDANTPSIKIDGPELGKSSTNPLTIGDHLIITFPFVLSIITLLFYLVVRQWDPLTSGTYATLVLLISVLGRDFLIRGISLSTVFNWVSNSTEGCKVGATMFAPITAVVVPIAIIINIFSLTGLPQRISFQIVSLTGASMVLLLLATMLLSILLGLGIPTIAAYIMVALFVAPALSEFGVNPLVAHMFVFYFAVLSTITPPIALSCAVASGIAEADFLQVTYETLRLGSGIFLIPFIFIINPELILWNNLPKVVFEFVLLCFGIATLTLFTVGYNGYSHLNLWQRVIFLLISITIIFGSVLFIRLGATVIAVISLTLMYRKARPPSRSRKGLEKNDFSRDEQ